MKRMLTIMLALASFTLTMAADACFAGGKKDMICVAEKIEGKQVTLKCKAKDSISIEVGAKYKLRKKLDGC